MDRKKYDIPELHQKKNALGKLSEIFIDRYRTIYLILMAVFIVGWMSYTDLPRENIPEVESNMVIISSVYSGASPDDIEEMITNPIEDAIAGQDDLIGYTSTSASGFARIILEFEFGIDMDETVDEVKKEIDGLDLPDEASEPNIMHLKTGEIPIMSMSVTGDMDLASISEAAEDLKTAFEAVPGVDSVELSGETESIVAITVHPVEMEAYGVSVNALSQAISAVNIGLPAGSAEMDGKKFNVRVDEAFNDIDDIRQVLVKTATGSVRVGDIADVNWVNDEGDQISRTYRKEAGVFTTPVVYMQVYRDNGADTIGPVNEIVKILEEEKGKLYPKDMEVIITSNFAQDVEESLGTVMDSALSGLLVVVLVLFLFIDLREAIIVSLVIPLSMFTSFILMNQVGITFNTISLMGFVIALGLLVDNAIVVIENIDRIRDYGLDRKLAAKIAINQVAPAVLAATLTTVSAFIPLALTPGMMGRMLRSLPLTILFAISASFLISLIITPTIASRVLEKYKGKEKKARGAASLYRKIASIATVGILALFAFRIDGQMGIFSFVGAGLFSLAMFVKQFKFKKSHGHGSHIDKYGDWLSGVLDNKKKRLAIIGLSVILLVGSVMLVPLGFIQLELMPSEEPDSMSIIVELPKGYLISDTVEIVGEIEDKLYTFDDIDNFTSSIGGNNDNEATISIELVDEDIRGMSGYDMVGALRKAVSDIPGADITVDAALNMGHRPGSGSPITINISGGSDEELEALATQYYETLKNVEGVEDATISSLGGLPELLVDFNETLAQAKGLNISSMALDIRKAISGYEVTDFRYDGQEVSVEIRTSEDRLDNVKDLEKIVFTNQMGEKIPFNEIATLRMDEGVSQIVHNDGQKYIQVGASGAPNANINKIVRTFQDKVKDVSLPEGVEVEYGGEFSQMNDSFADMGTNFVIALMLVYILLSVQFNSLTQPVVIILSVPLALIGTLIGLALTGNNLGFYSLFGVVSLVGIAVNDAIVLVDYTNYLRKEGQDRNTAIVEAVKTRFNPVLATSITTIGGVLPISVADPALGQLGFALIFGLVASTALTLMIIPIVYSMNDSLTAWIRDKFGLFVEEREDVINEA